MLVSELINFLLHIDSFLVSIVEQYGFWTYPLVFLIIFLETGIVITPFLPGDSLLFAAGAIAAVGNLNVFLLLTIIAFAAVIGDSVNYAIGYALGPKVFKENSKLLNKKYLYKAEVFYEKHGGKAIFLARFIPLLRTFAPFVAGIGKMNYSKFIFYNVVGAICWTSFFILTGYFFGNFEIVKENFSIFIILIIVASLIPLLIELIRKK